MDLEKLIKDLDELQEISVKDSTAPGIAYLAGTEISYGLAKKLGDIGFKPSSPEVVAIFAMLLKSSLEIAVKKEKIIT